MSRSIAAAVVIGSLNSAPTWRRAGWNSRAHCRVPQRNFHRRLRPGARRRAWQRAQRQRDASPEDLVLLFGVFDIFCQLIVGRGGDQGQEWVEYLGHCCMVVCCSVERDCTFVVPRYVLVSMPENGSTNRLFRNRACTPKLFPVRHWQALQ